MSLRWLIWSLASPSQLILLCLVAGALFIALRRFRIGKVLAVIGGAALFLCGVLPTGAYLSHVLETRFPQPQLPERVTGIVLISGAERPAISQAHGEAVVGARGQRFLTALRLAASYPEARIVYTGGPLKETGRGPLETQTAVAERILQSAGLDPRRLSFETASRDTCDNATNTRKLVDPQPGETWVVVTSAIHMPRTIACFRAAGWPEIIAQPADYTSAVGGLNLGSFQIVDNLDRFDMATHEWLGLAYYRLSGRTKEFFP
jgi:uncharacterized SAM-binding protein YcdF (DUF218 family)